jgi:hypothetical protein
MASLFRTAVTVYLAVWIIAIGTMPTDGWALVIPLDTSALQTDQRANDLGQIQRHLEAKLVTERLTELGLSSKEVQVRLSALTDDQLHQFARNLDGLQVGGDPALTFILIFVGAVLLAILFIYAVRPLFVDRHASTTAPVVVEPSHTAPPHHHWGSDGVTWAVLLSGTVRAIGHARRRWAKLLHTLSSVSAILGSGFSNQPMTWTSMKSVTVASPLAVMFLVLMAAQVWPADPFVDAPEKDDLPTATSPSSPLTPPAPRIVRDANRVGTKPPPNTVVALQASQNAGGRIALSVARIWLMEHGLRVSERRTGARQMVIVEYTHPLTVHVRGIDSESREVQWAGGAHVEGDVEQVDATILGDLTKEALASAWGLP